MKEDYRKMKYVVLDTPAGELPILIPMAMPHDYFELFLQFKELTGFIGTSMDSFKFFLKHSEKSIRAVSAGFFDLETLTTYGESIGLELKPRPGDAETIKVFFKLEDK